MPINKGQKGSKETQNATEANYAAWMQALLEDFAGEIPKLAYALHLILRTKEDRNPTDIKKLTNSIRHWYGERRSAPSIDDATTSWALVQLVADRQIAVPKMAQNLNFQDALTELQVYRSKNKIAGKESHANADSLLEQNVLSQPVSSVKNFALDSIDQISALFENKVPDYLPRDLDEEILSRLDNNFVPIVIIAGPPKSGKTRTALELLKRSKLKSRDLYWLSSLSGSAKLFVESVPVSNKSSTVIFIDDLQNFDFDPASGLTVARLKELAARGKVVATIHESAIEGFLNISRQRTSSIVSGEQDLSSSRQAKSASFQNSKLDIKDSIIILPRNVSRSEFDLMSEPMRVALNLQRFDNAFPLAASLASIDVLVSRAREIQSREDISSALLRGVLDAYLAFSGGASEDFILKLGEKHYQAIQRNSRWRQEKALDAFDELTAGVVPGSDKAILQRDSTDQEKFSVLDGLWEDLKPNPDTWNPEFFLPLLNEEQANEASQKIYDLGYKTQAKKILRGLVDTSFDPAVFSFASILWAEGEEEEAKNFYIEAANRGNLEAQNQLGVITEDSGDSSGAEAWYLKAAQGGYSWALYNLGVLYASRNQSEVSFTYLSQAAEQGLLEAQNKLGVLAYENDDIPLAREWCLRAAENGHNWAQYNLGFLAEKSEDVQEAIEWYTKAAEQGLAEAQTELGRLAKEVGNIELARTWLTKAAEANQEWAQFHLADLVEDASDTQSAIEWFTKASDHGLPQAQDRLGDIASRAGDIESAKNWYLKSAEAGYEWGQYDLAHLLSEAHDTDAATEWFTKAAEQGLPQAQNRLGNLASNAGDFELAKNWWLKAAEQNFAWAQYNLANRLNDEGDVQGAIDWHMKAAAQDLAQAQDSLGDIALESGDSPTAKTWYIKAAENGYSWGQYDLANLLDDEGDTEGAIEWYTKAAEQGLAHAQNRLGVIFGNGGDLELANNWYRKACESGYSWAQYNLAINLQNDGYSEEAQKLFALAAEQDITEAQNALGVLASEDGNLELAKQWYSKAAIGGDAWGQFNLAKIYESEGNTSLARKWMKKAVAQGDPEIIALTSNS